MKSMFKKMKRKQLKTIRKFIIELFVILHLFLGQTQYFITEFKQATESVTCFYQIFPVTSCGGHLKEV